MTPWVRRLLIANVVMFLVSSSLPGVTSVLVLYPPWILLRPWTLVTYMFLHAGLTHLLFNMVGLFFFGPRLERRLGGRSFLWLYFLAGIGGAIASFIFARQHPVVGASAAVYGVLLGFAYYWPKEKIYIWGVLPVEAWLLITLFVLGSLWAGFSGSASRVAHFAHLGGLGTAFMYLKWWEWRRGAGLRAFRKAMKPPTAGISPRSAVSRWQSIELQRLHPLNRDEVVRLLARVEREGPASLSPSEREFLDRMAAGS
ncbi:MAG: rhomboid family intramembrane serine protease [Gemmatimonadota bacterium]